MTTTTTTTTATDRTQDRDVRLVPVPTGAGVPLADRILLHLGLALLLASSRHAARPVREPRPSRFVQTGHATAETARPFC